MRKEALVIGLGMLLIGGYLFIQSMIMIIYMSSEFDWALWTVCLTVGIILVSFSPGVFAWSLIDRKPSEYEQTEWQIIKIPQICPECHQSIEIHSLEWIGPDEARCPFCSNRIEVVKNNIFTGL